MSNMPNNVPLMYTVNGDAISLRPTTTNGVPTNTWAHAHLWWKIADE